MSLVAAAGVLLGPQRTHSCSVLTRCTLFFTLSVLILGKYVPAMSYAIHQANQAHKAHLALESTEHRHIPSRHQQHQRKHAHAPHLKHSSRSAVPHGVPNGMPINLAGLSIGDGMMDPLTQVPGYGQYLFGLSLIDESQRDYMTAQEAKIVDLMNQQQWVPAFQLFDPLMMGDEVSRAFGLRARVSLCPWQSAVPGNQRE